MSLFIRPWRHLTSTSMANAHWRLRCPCKQLMLREASVSTPGDASVSTSMFDAKGRLWCLHQWLMPRGGFGVYINAWCQGGALVSTSIIDMDTKASHHLPNDMGTEVSLRRQPLTWTPEPSLGINHRSRHQSLPWVSTVDMDTEASPRHQLLMWTPRRPLGIYRSQQHQSLPWVSTIDVITEASFVYLQLMWTMKPPLGVDCWCRHRSLPWAL